MEEVEEAGERRGGGRRAQETKWWGFTRLMPHPQHFPHQWDLRRRLPTLNFTHFVSFKQIVPLRHMAHWKSTELNSPPDDELTCRCQSDTATFPRHPQNLLGPKSSKTPLLLQVHHSSAGTSTPLGSLQHPDRHGCLQQRCSYLHRGVENTPFIQLS